MRDPVLISRLFYPGGASLLLCLTACVALSLVAHLAIKVCGGRMRQILIAIATALCLSGAAVCIGMIAAEVLVFDLALPLAATGYAVLLCAFAGLIARSFLPARLRIFTWASIALSIPALGYLLIAGSIPRMFELRPEQLGGIEGSNILGSGENTLLVTEFGDFECPPCAVQERIMDKLWSAYSDRIRYNFRHLPRPRHPHAVPAALASQCAAEQGVFWQTSRLLFASQDRLGAILSRPELPTIPAARMKAFADCVRSGSALPSVTRDQQWAEKAGVRATPSIIIGNTLIQGVTSYPRIEFLVERELRRRNIVRPQQAASAPTPGCGGAVASCAE